MRRAGSAFALMVAGLGACGGAEPPAPTDQAWTIERAQMVFSARRDGRLGIYRLDRAAGTSTLLTDPDAEEFFGRVSPDGQRMALQSRSGRTTDIEVLTFDTGARWKLTDHPDWDVLPVWSPDGTRLAFMSTRGFALGSLGPFPGHIYIAAVDGTGARPVTSDPLTSSLGPQAWSPDGRSLLLSRAAGDARPDLVLLDLETGQERTLAEGEEGEYGADFSHDGRWIAFHVESADASRIEIMRVDGAERRVVVAGAGFRYGPRWSPDDRWLAFSFRGPDREDVDVLAVRVNDGEIVPLVATEEDERDPDWMPAGRSPARPDRG